MASLKLSTDRQIAGLKPAAKRYEAGVSSSPGLAVRIHPSGLKQFEYRYVAVSGKRRRFILGSYPDLSLSEARTRVGALRTAVVSGGDPVGDMAAAKEQARTGETLDELAEAYWQAGAVGLHGGRRRPKREVTLYGERKTWRNHITAKLGHRRFTEIKRADVKVFMRELVMGGRLSAASIASIGGLLHAVLGFAVLEERLESNPALGLARPLAVTSRERMFNDEALKTIWDWADLSSLPRGPDEKTAGVHARLEPVTGLAIQFLMLTLTRRNEVAGALKAEFDREAGLWIIPSARAKAKHQHVVPLGPDCLRVLEEAWVLDPNSPFVFPSERVPGQHLETRAITRAFARTCSRKKLAPGSPHDVRRSGATTLTGRYGVSRFVVGLVLGHTPNEGAAVTGVYDRHTYVPEKREALLKWAGHLTSIGKVVANVPEARAAALKFERQSPVDAAAPVELHVRQAKARAHDLCVAGDLHEAVLSMCMDMSRRPETATSHMDILARAGLAIAKTGSREQVAGWIEGFR
ncbi:MAG: tyrosine-type recombinase/integrase [Brevundimonas sp.]|jgi:integrase|uniref:tyrosine-type recombinase/integrase n=1 Tax=Brevundimonas sp. TaxID=1871086 RepID=UPI0025C29D26|nr:site-specific integrase [Brevundimonas sp.]MCH4269503.1 tyrosine-type recombinase/integrase [Brevundimonas sp.]